MTAQLKRLIDRLEKDGRPGLKNSLAISWVCYDKSNPRPCSGIGTNWSAKRLFYPASVVKLFYAIATEAWLQKDLIPESRELRRALNEMITISSNDATSLIIDLLTATTSGPSLRGDQWIAWQKQRQLVNHWLRNFNWPELEGINCCQKTWGDGAFGRENDFYGEGKSNRNLLSTDATARIMEAVMTNALVSPPACKRLRTLLSRSLDLDERESDVENQIDGFLGEGIPKGSRIWSKAG